MAPHVSALSQTLESLTRSKIRELEKQRSSFEERKARILADADIEADLHSKVSGILNGVKTIHPTASKDAAVVNMERWLDQRQFDDAVTDDMLQEYETDLRARLDAHSQKLSLADLYSRLLTEWTNASVANEGDIAEDDYTVVDERQKQRLQQLCDQFESVVFTPLETNPLEIHSFLDSLFPLDEQKEKLENLRETLENLSQGIFEEDAPFDEESLTATIKGLVTEDLLSEAKQEVLKGFLKNSVALTEIADVLNMRWADLENWDSFADDGIPVLPRQQLNGKYRIWMDENVLQLIFVQYIGTRLCNMLKAELLQFIQRDGVWDWNVSPPTTEIDDERRAYYLGSSDSRNGPDDLRKLNYLDPYFLTQLPLELTTLAAGGAPYDDDNDSSTEQEPGWSRSQEPENRTNIKQQLLRKVATETLIQRYVYNEAVVIQSDLRWYGTGLPHSTIFAIMSYIGLSERWISFFRKYLESPLNMDQSAEGRTPRGPRPRKRGAPIAHSSEKFIGELILFFMDLAVNRTTGLLLYRLHDDLWLSGEPEKCAKAWEIMGEFAKVTGLEFNLHKTGSVYLSEAPDSSIESRLPKGPVTFGFLKLNSSAEWEIDQKQVDAHVNQLKAQLDQSDSVMAWIRTWNSCIGRFFKNTFGQPAACFGQRHVDMILEAYKSMQQTLFKNTTGTVTQHLRQMIKTRFGVSDIPDALFYYPEELGGLGLRNPAVSPFLLRNSLTKSPLELIQVFLEKEQQAYATLKKTFNELPQTSRTKRFICASNGNERHFVSRAERDTFMSFEEWTRFRWSHSYPFQHLYRKLQEVPSPQGLEYNRRVSDELVRTDLRSFDKETQWILHMYAPEVLKRYGGLSLVDRKYLPMGLMAMVKERRVKWQMVL
ncbi:hypothetical protein BJX70DRAFT_337699 [Aspergillus crustosus]